MEDISTVAAGLHPECPKCKKDMGEHRSDCMIHCGCGKIFMITTGKEKKPKKRKHS
jgi:hypothetical protein